MGVLGPVREGVCQSDDAPLRVRDLEDDRAITPAVRLPPNVGIWGLVTYAE